MKEDFVRRLRGSLLQARDEESFCLEDGSE